MKSMARRGPSGKRLGLYASADGRRVAALFDVWASYSGMWLVYYCVVRPMGKSNEQIPLTEFEEMFPLEVIEVKVIDAKRGKGKGKA